jgi:hypothetical protein
MNENDKYKKYICYFQKVVTVGIPACGKNYQEAEEEAKAVMNEGDVKYCFFDETEFELSDSEEHNPKLEVTSINPSADGKALLYSINYNNEFLEDVSKITKISVSEINEETLQKFFLDSMKSFVKKGEEKFGKDV